MPCNIEYNDNTNMKTNLVIDKIVIWDNYIAKATSVEVTSGMKVSQTT